MIPSLIGCAAFLGRTSPDGDVLLSLKRTSETAEFRLSCSSDIDARIDDVKEQIAIYQNRAFYTDREAQRLMTRDFFAYRRYLIERDRDLGTVRALQRKLAELEAEKASQANDL
jgi:hypothetical protein